MVGGGDEKYLGKVKGNIQIVIAKGRVLFGIQDLEQCRGRIAMEGRPDFINFIEHNDRIRGAHSLHGLDEFPGHGTDISSTVSLNLCFVSHPPKGKAKKLAV